MDKITFIEKAKLAHGDKYDYSKVDYVNGKTPVIITCPIHGEFKITPYAHIYGQGCKECSKMRKGKKKCMSTEEFIRKAKEIHGDKYDYSKVEYVNNKTKVCIICHEVDNITGEEHGEFWQLPSSHLSGNGCRKCGLNIIKNARKMSTEEFIRKAKLIHGNKYDYSKVIYNGTREKIRIICPIHGEFLISPNGHLNGNGCRECGKENIRQKNALNLEDFIYKAKEVHGDKYDYSKVAYKNNRTKVCIICPEHGEFWQRPYQHLQGQNCPKCAITEMAKKNTLTTEEWIAKAREIHGNRYDYSLSVYRGYYEKIRIICPIHGEFTQLAYNHIQGKGCPKCRKSKMEIEISNFLNENNINFIEQYRPKFLSNGKSHLTLDFYLPEYNAAIECQGKQHFVVGTFFDKRKETIKERDERKYKLCKGKIRLFYYSNINNIENYLDKIYSDKVILLNDIKNKN